MDKLARITINTDRLEFDLDYKIENSELIITYFGIVTHYYYGDEGKLSDEINPDHIREMMDTINRSMWNRDFTIRILTMIPPLLQQYQRNDLAAVALDWLSMYHMDPPKNQMRL